MDDGFIQPPASPDESAQSGVGRGARHGERMTRRPRRWACARFVTARASRELNERRAHGVHPWVAAGAMPSPLDLKMLAALVAAAVAFGIVVAGEPAGLAALALLFASALAVSLVWRQ